MTGKILGVQAQASMHIGLNICVPEQADLRKCGSTFVSAIKPLPSLLQVSEVLDSGCSFMNAELIYFCTCVKSDIGPA